MAKNKGGWVLYYEVEVRGNILQVQLHIADRARGQTEKKVFND